MAGVEFRFVVVQDEISPAIDQIRHTLENLEPFLLDVGPVVTDDMLENWVGRGNWPPLKASTLARKAREGYDLSALVRSEALIDAVAGDEWQAGQVGSGTFEAVLPVPGYGFYHRQGTRFMPARDWAFISDDVVGDIENIFAEYILQGLGFGLGTEVMGLA